MRAAEPRGVRQPGTRVRSGRSPRRPRPAIRLGCDADRGHEPSTSASSVPMSTLPTTRLADRPPRRGPRAQRAQADRSARHRRRAAAGDRRGQAVRRSVGGEHSQLYLVDKQPGPAAAPRSAPRTATVFRARSGGVPGGASAALARRSVIVTAMPRRRIRQRRQVHRRPRAGEARHHRSERVVRQVGPERDHVGRPRRVDEEQLAATSAAEVGRVAPTAMTSLAPSAR